MDERKEGSSWWQTMPGILTGVAALITAVGGLIAVMHQGGKTASKVTPPAQEQTSVPAPKPDTAGSSAASTNSNVPVAAGNEVPPGASNQVRAGHFLFKVLGTSAESYSTAADGKPQKVALNVSIRITDLVGRTDYVDGNTIRLAVDGAELTPQNSVNVAVYEKQSVETEALFVVPADATRIELLVGRADDAVGKLPLTLNLTKSRP